MRLTFAVLPDGQRSDRVVADCEMLFEVGDAAGEVALQADGDAPDVAAFLPDAGHGGRVGVFARSPLPPRPDGGGTSVGSPLVGDGGVGREGVDRRVVVAAVVRGEIGAD